jgi:hypothetical protein
MSAEQQQSVDEAVSFIENYGASSSNDSFTNEQYEQARAEAKAALSAMVAEIIGEDIEHSEGCKLTKENYSKPENMCLCRARITNFEKSEARQRAIAKGFAL